MPLVPYMVQKILNVLSFMPLYALYGSKALKCSFFYALKCLVWFK